MRLMKNAIVATIVGIVATATIVVVSCIVVMFSTGSADGRSSGLFGAIFFEATTDADGVTTATGGIADPAPIVVLLVIVTAATVAVGVVYELLRNRQRSLRPRAAAGGRAREADA